MGRKITQFVSEKSRPLAEQILKKFSVMGDNFNQAVVKSISTLAEGLGALSIAERVESQEVLDWLAEQGLDFAQGFHLGHLVSL